MGKKGLLLNRGNPTGIPVSLKARVFRRFGHRIILSDPPGVAGGNTGLQNTDLF